MEGLNTCYLPEGKPGGMLLSEDDSQQDSKTTGANHGLQKCYRRPKRTRPETLPPNCLHSVDWSAANGGVTNGGLRGVSPPFLEIGQNRPFSPFFCLFRPFPEGAKSTWEIQKTEEKGLFPQISSDLLKPPSLKPPAMRHSSGASEDLEFPNVVVLHVVVLRNTQLSASERKRAQTQVRQRAKKSAKAGQTRKTHNSTFRKFNRIQEIPSQKRSRHPKCLFYCVLVPLEVAESGPH